MTVSYPTTKWDGDTGNRSVNQRKSPDYRDWNRIVEELAAAQNQQGIAANASVVGTVGSDVTEVSERCAVQRTVLTLDDIAITIVDGTTKEVGSALIHTFPAGAIKVLGVTVNLTATAAVNFAGTGVGDYSLGSAAATDQVLAGTDLTWSTDSAAFTITTVVSDLHDQGEIVAIYNGTSSAGPVYLNLAFDAGEGSGIVTVAGTVTILWVNVGDY